MDDAPIMAAPQAWSTRQFQTMSGKRMVAASITGAAPTRNGSLNWKPTLVLLALKEPVPAQEPPVTAQGRGQAPE